MLGFETRLWDHRGTIMNVSEAGVGPRLSLRQRLTWIAHLFKAVVYQYHRPLALRIGPLLSADSILIDVGAHSGQHAKLFAGLVPGGAVFAFEPGAYARSILTIATRLHGPRNVHIVGLGLSDQAAVETLHVPLKRRGTVGFGLSHLGASNDGRKTIAEEVQLTTLDLFVQENQLRRVDFIKVDIEGWEAHFLRGAADTIARFRPSLFLEVAMPMLSRAGSTPADIFDALIPLDYAVFETREHDDYRMRSVKGFEGSSDYLFVPKERAHLVPVG